MDVDFTAVAKSLASPARSAMISHLLDGRAMTAGELARAAGVLPPTASEHLAQLVGAGVVTMTIQGRHRYFRISDAETAEALEALAHICPRTTAHSLTGSMEDAAQSLARMCYDHIAGRLGVRILDGLVLAQWLRPADAGFDVTHDGYSGLRRIGVDTAALRSQRRTFARSCPDWTERRPHLAGALGAGIASSLLEQHWVERHARRRGLHLTDAGAAKLSEVLCVEAGDLLCQRV